MLSKYFLFIGLLTAICFNHGLCQAPLLKFKHITDEQGLSNTSVECILQDHRGFMWFGTLDGLNRYDGYNITVYNYEPKDTSSISDNTIQCIYEDRQNRLWIGTSNGLNLFDQTTNKFIRYIHSSNPNSISDNNINDIYEDTGHNLWIATAGGGLNLFDRNKSEFKHLVHRDNQHNSLSNNEVNSICEDTKGNFWVATNNGLNLFNRQKNSFSLVKNLTDKASANNADYNNIQQVKCDHQNNLWMIANDHGLIFFNHEKNIIKNYTHQDSNPNSIGSDILRHILIDHAGKVWIGGINAGLNLYDPQTNSFINYHHEPENSTSLSQKSVKYIYEDKQDNLWVGTLRGGVNLYTPQSGRFKLYKQTASPLSLSYDDIRSFHQDKSGNIWVGADGGGLDLFNEKNGTFKHYRHDPNNPSSLSSSAIISITGDSNDNLWISTWNGGLNKFNSKTGTFIHYRHNPADKNSINSDFVRKAFEDSEHNMWIATDVGGVNLFDRNTNKFSRLTQGTQNKTHLWGNNIIDINEDDQKNLWILTLDSGINCYNFISKQFSHYLYNKNGATNDIAFAFTDSKGRFWIGKKGLYLFDRARDKFTLYTHLAGLADEYIKGILEDNDGNLWISTSNGITKFNPDTYAFKKFNVGDGLQGLEFEVGSCMKAKNGELFFGGVNGFNVFYPGNIRSNPNVPPVYLTDFQILNKSVAIGLKDSPLKEDISVTKEIYLTYRQSTFSLLFSALNYVAPENNQYAYKLESFDKNWVKAGTERKASYTNIDPGEYTFTVKASNNDGLWNEKGAQIKIFISPPFWSTWWFRSIIVIILLTCVYLILYFRRAFELRRMEEKKNEEMHQVQLQFFTNISHEFRTPLSLILGPLEKITHETSQRKTTHYYHTIHRNANRLMSLINELMDFRKVESGVLKLKVSNTNLNVFLENITEEFRDLSETKKIDLTISEPSKFEKAWFDSKLLEKIILNLLNNAFKYTGDDGKVSVELCYTLDSFTPEFGNELIVKNPRRSKDYFHILVKDNGIGISKESIDHLFERYYRISSTHLGSGVGLAFVKSLTMLHKGDITVYSERNIGTEFIISLPYSEDNYGDDEKWTDASEGGTSLESPIPKIIMPVIEEEQIDESPEINATKHNILLVDDNDELRDFLKGALAAHYEIIEATDGFSGLKKLEHEHVDLIISDIMMPRMNGIDFCKAVKNDMETSHIPFILLTAKDALESKIEGAESGADIYLSKPVSINLLLLTIRNIFEKQQKQKDRYLNDYYAEAKGLVNSSKDRDFIEKLTQIIDSQLINPELDVEFLCSEIYMSKTKLYQKIKGITGQSIAEFIRTFRLKKAIQIMTHEDVPLTEVTYRVGFLDASYFSRVFKKEYGKTPTQFLQDIKKQHKKSEL
jgi:signal transduction histidine kinase/ligand-binding sensor domain-containing protein/CheY-like chemotaxis protein/AraC-like DNA-binding protein